MKKTMMVMLCSLLVSPLSFANEYKGEKYLGANGKIQYCKGEVQCSDPDSKYCECLPDPEFYKQRIKEEKEKATKNKQAKQ